MSQQNKVEQKMWHKDFNDVDLFPTSYSLDTRVEAAVPEIGKLNPEFAKSTIENKGGTKHDGNKPPMSLIPTKALIEEAYVWGMGEKKYGRYNWEKGLIFSRLIDAILRHVTAYNNGETLDPESGRSHMAHIRCDAAMLIEFESTRPDLDDRRKK